MKLTNKKGFTIVELVIVIAVIAILAAVLIPTFSSVTKTAKQSAALQQAKSGLDSVIALTGGVLPDGTLFSVTDSEDGKVSYNFEYKNNSLQTNTDLKKEPETAGEGYYAIYVSAKCFSTDANKAREKTIPLIVSVLKNTFSTATTATFSENPDTNGDYYTMTLMAGNTAVADTPVFRIYYNGDINETLVVFIGNDD